MRMLKYCEKCDKVYFTAKMYCECGGRLKTVKFYMKEVSGE